MQSNLWKLLEVRMAHKYEKCFYGEQYDCVLLIFNKQTQVTIMSHQMAKLKGITNVRDEIWKSRFSTINCREVNTIALELTYAKLAQCCHPHTFTAEKRF